MRGEKGCFRSIGNNILCKLPTSFLCNPKRRMTNTFPPSPLTPATAVVFVRTEIWSGEGSWGDGGSGRQCECNFAADIDWKTTDIVTSNATWQYILLPRLTKAALHIYAHTSMSLLTHYYYIKIHKIFFQLWAFVNIGYEFVINIPFTKSVSDFLCTISRSTSSPHY